MTARTKTMPLLTPPFLNNIMRSFPPNEWLHPDIHTYKPVSFTTSEGHKVEDCLRHVAPSVLDDAISRALTDITGQAVTAYITNLNLEDMTITIQYGDAYSSLQLLREPFQQVGKSLQCDASGDTLNNGDSEGASFNTSNLGFVPNGTIADGLQEIIPIPS